MDTHALKPDLEAIRELAANPLHPRRAEGRAALAIYEDVCWRLALAHFPPNVTAEVTRLENEAAGLLRAYVNGTSAPEAFWHGFEAVVEALDALTVPVAVQEQDEWEAGRALKALRAEVAEAALAPIIRRRVQSLLEVMATTLLAFHDGKLPAADFWPLFEQGRRAVTEAMAEADGLEADSTAERLHRVAEAALAVDPPVFMRQAIAERLLDLVEAWEAREPLEESTLAELEGLIERARQFQEVHGEAERLFRDLDEAIRERALSGPFAREAEAQLGAMRELSAALEAGRLEPDTFRTRFAVAAHRLEQLLQLVGSEPSELGEAQRLLAAARARVAEASLPRFVALTAQDLLAYMARLVQDQRVAPGEPGAFWAEFRADMSDLEVCLTFGREVVHEKTEALRRVEALERRVGDRELHPMLRGPVADLLETLRNLLNRLDAGLFHLTEFHRVFDEAADRLEQLLMWQGALDQLTVPAPVPASVSFHHPEA